jgi:hypothetical protein
MCNFATVAEIADFFGRIGAASSARDFYRLHTPKLRRMCTAEPRTEGTHLVSSRCARLRRLGPLVEQAFRASMQHEGGPAYAELEARYQELEEEYEALAREVWATPVTSWKDIMERAELAYAYANDDPAKNQTADDLGTRAAAELVMAVLQMIGGEGWREPYRQSGPEAHRPDRRGSQSTD